MLADQKVTFIDRAERSSGATPRLDTWQTRAVAVVGGRLSWHDPQLGPTGNDQQRGAGSRSSIGDIHSSVNEAAAAEVNARPAESL